MATFDIVILSSSPPASSGNAAKPHGAPPDNEQHVGMSTYSTRAPSPFEEPKKRSSSALKSSARAAAAPDGAARGFATASSLLMPHHSRHESDSEFAENHNAQLRVQVSGEGQEKPKEPRKRATKSAATRNGAKPTVKEARARKPKARKGDDNEHAESLAAATTASSYFTNSANADTIASPAESHVPLTKPKSTKPGKPRATTTKSESQKKVVLLEKRSVSKQKAAAKSEAKSQKKSTSTVSGHFGAGTVSEGGEHAESAQQTSDMHFTEEDSIWDVPTTPRRKRNTSAKQRPPTSLQHGWDLDEVVARRRDWTPIRDTHTQDAFVDTITHSMGKENNHSPSSRKNDKFTSMLSNFTFANMEAPPATISQQKPLEGVAGMKKRRVEVIDVPGNDSASRISSPEKNKAPKKKARTITGLVTGQYAPQELGTDPTPFGSNFFDSRKASTKVPLNDVVKAPSVKAPTKPTRKRAPSKASAKEGSKSKKAYAKTAAKPKMVADKLLSPTTAIVKMNKQDVLFGTSSQLASEESPTLIRQIQQALRDSEQDAPSSDVASDATSCSRINQRLERLRGKRQLWAASARDEDGQLLERQDDIYIPEPDRTQDFPLLMDKAHDAHDSSFVDIDDIQPLPPQDLRTPPSALHVISRNNRNIVTDKVAITHEALNDLTFDDISDYEPPPPSNQNASFSFPDIDDLLPSANQTASVAPLPLPPTTAVTPASPTRKRRGRPPKENSAIPKQKPIYKQPPKVQALRPPTTPPKPKARFADIEEILDSEDDEALSPTPPRTSVFASSRPLPLAPSQAALQNVKSISKNQNAHEGTYTNPDPIFRVPTSHLTWAEMKDSIFRRIMEHIRSIPPTNDPAKPSWYEKILMYDPIVLEEFTAYLNEKTEIRVSRRASVKQIKAWNKMMKESGGEVLGVNGTGNDDGDEETALTVNKELESWMVQGWCQEFSVCCIWKEKGGRGCGIKGLY